jgi:poly(A) polymerase/tRNA nucleotidyltransferase (CCA-adding enzyme)
MLDYSLQFQNTSKEVRMVCALLEHSGYEAYIVGGCVRDLIMDKVPNDYDVTTNATPEQIIALFPRTFYENTYGTVGVVTAAETETDVNVIKKSIVEVTPFRTEGEYKDGRHPENVSWAKDIKTDLSRRDFTCNAMAYSFTKNELVDPFEGLKDIKDRVLRAVGEADVRFNEDALRLMRALRFSGQLDFKIEENTETSLINNAVLIQNISHERVRDEFCKILLTPNPKQVLEYANQLGILKYFLPELERGIGISQNQAHKFDVWEHNLRTMQHAVDKNWPLELRLAALFHDISKPETRRFSHEKNDYTFYGHEVVGARITREIMERLKFSKDDTEYVSTMVRWHMFFSDTEQITLSAVRRMISNVGKDNIWDLMNLRICDRVGTGRPKEEPYRFRQYQSMVEQALQDPVTLKMLKIDGKRIMDVTQETPGPKIGLVLHALFAEVLDDPSKNTTEYLEKRARELVTHEIKYLKELADQGKTGMESENEKQVADIKKQFHVK